MAQRNCGVVSLLLEMNDVYKAVSKEAVISNITVAIM
jgi:hypothetical protein